MELNKKEKCENLIERWKYLDEKFPKVWSIKPGGRFELNNIIIQEIDELKSIEQKLINECNDYLSKSQKNKLFNIGKNNQIA
jgi:hypothetical protein